MKLGTFEARCADCGSAFAKPELSDFAYGQFLFTGERGTVYAYLEAIEHPVWTRLATAMPTVNDKAVYARLLQAACAHFADPVEGQRLLNRHVCPQCHSSDLASWNGRKQGVTEVPVASFDRFLSPTEAEQLNEAKAFYAATHGI